MSLERAIKIFAANEVVYPQKVVEAIISADSLEALENTEVKPRFLSARQFVSVRMVQLFEGDPEFANNTLENAKVVLSKYDIPEELVIVYISRGGGEDVATPMRLDIQLGKYGTNVIYDEIKSKLDNFFKDADVYLFDALRSYVINS